MGSESPCLEKGRRRDQQRRDRQRSRRSRGRGENSHGKTAPRLAQGIGKRFKGAAFNVFSNDIKYFLF